MLQFDEHKVTQILTEELHLNEEQIEITLEILLDLHDDLQPHLDQWLLDRTLSSVKIHGISLDMIYQHSDVKDFIGALIQLDLFVDDKPLAELFIRNPYLAFGRR